MRTGNDAFLIFSGIGSVLVLASLAGYILKMRVRQAAGVVTVENLNARIRGWWWITAILGGALLAGRAAVVVLFAVISFVALREFLTQTAVRSADHPALLASFLIFLPAQYILVGLGRDDLFVITVPLFCFLALPILIALSGETKDFLPRTAELLWGLSVCVYFISYVPAVLTLRIPGYEGREVLLIMFLILVVQAGDVLQYVWGKLLGRRKVAPELSPSKTVEGLLGGVASATALGTGLWWMTPFSILQTAGMAFVILLAGFLGGLVMSAIKRDRGIKDWSQFISGHGGMLDRLDSVCFAAPVFFHMVRYWWA